LVPQQNGLVRRRDHACQLHRAQRAPALILQAGQSEKKPSGPPAHSVTLPPAEPTSCSARSTITSEHEKRELRRAAAAFDLLEELLNGEERGAA
jgi:hypothetical protein